VNQEKDMFRAKKRKNIDSCIEVTEEIPKYSNLAKHGVSGLPIDPSFIIDVSSFFEPPITQFMYNVSR